MLPFRVFPFSKAIFILPECRRERPPWHSSWRCYCWLLLSIKRSQWIFRVLWLALNFYCIHINFSKINCALCPDYFTHLNMQKGYNIEKCKWSTAQYNQQYFAEWLWWNTPLLYKPATSHTYSLSNKFPLILLTFGMVSPLEWGLNIVFVPYVHCF